MGVEERRGYYEPAKMIRLARLLDTTAWYHARKAQALTDELAAVCAAFQPDG